LDGATFAKEKNAFFFEVSSKSNDQVKHVFQTIGVEAMKLGDGVAGFWKRFAWAKYFHVEWRSRLLTCYKKNLYSDLSVNFE
jgi:hypothetical protein